MFLWGVKMQYKIIIELDCGEEDKNSIVDRIRNSGVVISKILQVSQ
jgi:hypothetical protein